MAHLCVALSYSNTTHSVLTVMSQVGSVKIPPSFNKLGHYEMLPARVGLFPIIPSTMSWHQAGGKNLTLSLLLVHLVF